MKAEGHRLHGDTPPFVTFPSVWPSDAAPGPDAPPSAPSSPLGGSTPPYSIPVEALDILAAYGRSHGNEWRRRSRRLNDWGWSRGATVVWYSGQLAIVICGHQPLETGSVFFPPAEARFRFSEAIHGVIVSNRESDTLGTLAIADGETPPSIRRRVRGRFPEFFIVRSTNQVNLVVAMRVPKLIAELDELPAHHFLLRCDPKSSRAISSALGSQDVAFVNAREAYIAPSS